MTEQIDSVAHEKHIAVQKLANELTKMIGNSGSFSSNQLDIIHLAIYESYNQVMDELIRLNQENIRLKQGEGNNGS